MKTLTKENFTEALTGNSIVFFHRLKGCGNCEKSLPVVESFKKDGVEVFAVDVDTEKELVNKYAPNTRWNLPLTVYFENGEAVNTVTETLDAHKLMEATKTLQNVSDIELQKTILDIEVTRATQRKQLFEIDETLARLNEEAQRRMNKAPIPPRIPVPEIVDPSDDTGCDGCQ